MNRPFSLFSLTFALVVGALLLVTGVMPAQAAVGLAFIGSTLAVTNPTLLDFVKRMTPDGSIDRQIVEILNQTNEILDDMTFVEGNLPTGHRSTIRTGIPAPTWRKLYGFVQPGKSTTSQVTDSCGMLEAYAEVDKALADLNGNSASWRASEDRAFIEGMGQELAASVFFANEATAPEEITGLAPRFNDQSANNGENILTDAATPDSTDNASIWLVVWGPNTVHGILPKDSKSGLMARDLGEVTIQDTSGGRMQAYRTHYRWDVGLCVRDWRYVVRIQVDQEDVVKDAATGPDLIDLMTQALEIVPSLSAGRPVFYMNRTLRSFLRRQIRNSVKNSTLSVEQIAGKRVLTFDEVPVRRCDALTNTESGI